MRRTNATRSTVSSSTITTPEPSDSAGGARALERQRDVELVGRGERAGSATEQHGLQRAAGRDATGQVDQLRAA